MSDSQREPVMYRMKPVFEQNILFETSSSMYKMKNLETCPLILSNNVQVNQDAVKPEDNEEVLTRQEKLLSNLYQLQKDVSALQSKLNELKNVSNSSTSTTSAVFDKMNIRDFVINADPKHPPYALLWLPKLWDLQLNVTFHLHSTVSSLPNNLSIFDKLKKDRIDASNPSLTFVWKEVGEDTQLVLSPMKCKTILGEVNLLRFFDYTVSANEDALQQIRKNEILDLAHCLNHAPSRDQQSLLGQLEKRLGSGKWFSATPTIADAAVWSAVVKLNKNALPAGLKKFMISCAEFSGLKLPK